MILKGDNYQFVGRLFLKRSRVLPPKSQPKDDVVHWLFLKIDDKRLSFVYKIQDPDRAIYESYFNAYIRFTMYESIERVVELDRSYEVLRGEESIGRLVVTKYTGHNIEDNI